VKSREEFVAFTLATFNAVGDMISPKEAGDAWLRAWKELEKHLGACINCGRRFGIKTLRYWFGANKVGPFCEACDATIKLHTRFKERHG